MTTAEFDLRLGAALARERERAGLAQESLARQLDCDQSLVSRVERGRRSLTVSELFLWADHLGVPYRPLLQEVAVIWQGVRGDKGSLWLTDDGLDE